MCWNFSLIASLSLAHIVQLIITAILSPLCETGLFPVAFLSFVSIHCWLPGAHSLKSQSQITVSNLPCIALSAYTAGYLVLTVSNLPCIALSAYTAGYLVLTVSNLPCIGTDFPIAFLTFVGIHCWLPDPHSHLFPLCACQHTLLIFTATCLPCVLLSAYTAGYLIVRATCLPCVRLAYKSPVAFLTFASIHCCLHYSHSYLSPLTGAPTAFLTFVSIHCWLQWPHSHLSPLSGTGVPTAFLTFVSIHCWLQWPHSHLSPLSRTGLALLPSLPLSAYTAGYSGPTVIYVSLV